MVPLLLASAALLTTGLLLERACRIPKPPEDQNTEE
jgi:hypothetical protein